MLAERVGLRADPRPVPLGRREPHERVPLARAGITELPGPRRHRGERVHDPLPLGRAHGPLLGDPRLGVAAPDDDVGPAVRQRPVGGEGVVPEPTELVGAGEGVSVEVAGFLVGGGGFGDGGKLCGVGTRVLAGVGLLRERPCVDLAGPRPVARRLREAPLRLAAQPPTAPSRPVSGTSASRLSTADQSSRRSAATRARA